MESSRLYVIRFASLLAITLTLHAPPIARGQSTVITYQGRLESDGALFTGIAEFQPTLWDNSSGGAQIAANSPAAIIVPVTNGLFVLPLDFGSAPFDTGAARWLQLDVRTAIGPFTTLAPRQRLTPTPYSLYSTTAATAQTAAVANSVSATNIVGALTLAQLPPFVVTNNGSAVSLTGTFAGSGSALTNVNALNLVAPSTNVSVFGWGGNLYGQRTIPNDLGDVLQVSGGGAHSLALKPDRTVVAWGAGKTNVPNTENLGQSIVPPGLANVVKVAAGHLHSVALRQDGTVVAWGWNDFHQTNVPPGLNDVVDVSAGAYHNVALKSDGTVVQWGTNIVGLLDMPPGLNNVMAVEAGIVHSVVLRSNGTVIAWGSTNDFSQTNVPPGLNDVVAIAAGGAHTLALRANGTVVAWGAGTNNSGEDFNYGQSMVPPGLNDVVAVSAGYAHSTALKSDGTVVAWGRNEQGETNIPPGLNSVIALARGPGATHTLALRKRVQAPVAWLDSDNTFNGNVDINGDVDIAGELTTLGDLRLNDRTLWLRGGGDTRNGLAWHGAEKTFAGESLGTGGGPVLFGENRGVLGTSDTNGPKAVLSWNSSGEVGLGTLFPGARLSLGNDFADRKLIVASTFNGAMGLGATDGQFRFFLPTFGGDRFAFHAVSSGSSEIFTITKAGSVGIGASSPTAKLDVRGDIRLGSSGQFLATGGTENLRIIRGVLTAAGGIITGSGFTASHPSTGVYTITFSPSFGGLPTMTVSADSQGGIPRTAMTDGVTGSTASIRVMTVSGSPANTDAPVHFIAIGPR